MPCLYDQIAGQLSKQKENLKRLKLENDGLKEKNKTLGTNIETLEKDEKSLRSRALTLAQAVLQMQYEKELANIGGSEQ